MSLLCTNCRRFFRHTGFTLHGLRTSNQQCREAYQKAIADQLLHNVEGLSDVDSVHEDDNEDGEAALMSDLGGNEAQALGVDDDRLDFDWTENDHHLQWFADDIDADHFDADHSNDNRSNAANHPDTDSDTDSDMEELDVGIPAWPTNDADIVALDVEVPQAQFPSAEPELAEGRPLEGEPDLPNYPTPHDADVVIEQFTEGRAGAPVDNRGVPAHIKYQNKVNNPDNIFEPFNSKLDWEFAQWAKTQGSSSSAVTDLLSIEGVSANLGCNLPDV
jgi:hypothetical protein